jgi:hypothetical protein
VKTAAWTWCSCSALGGGDDEEHTHVKKKRDQLCFGLDSGCIFRPVVDLF